MNNWNILLESYYTKEKLRRAEELRKSRAHIQALKKSGKIGKSAKGVSMIRRGWANE